MSEPINEITIVAQNIFQRKNVFVGFTRSDLWKPISPDPVCTSGGKPSTWFPPEGPGTEVTPPASNTLKNQFVFSFDAKLILHY